MNPIRLSYLIFILITAFSSSVFSAEEAGVSEDNSDEASEALATKSDDNDSTRMLRHTQDIKGYQPITIVGQDITATYLEETFGERFGAIIMLHDQGEQLESNGVITPLRHTLPEHGWFTLTVLLDYTSEPNISSVDHKKATISNSVITSILNSNSPDKLYINGM